MSSPKLPSSLQSASNQPFLSRFPLTNFQSPNGYRKLMKWLNLGSFGGRLFWMISLSTLGGLGGMALSFSHLVRDQAEEQVRGSLDGKVNAIAAVTETTETLAYGLGVSATTLHERGAQYPDTYREIVFQLFERRPEFVIGLGLGQSENGLIVDQPWLFPYYSLITSEEDTSFDQDIIIYEDLADNRGEFYPESRLYQQYFVPQASVWSEPSADNNQNILTYYLPMFGQEGKWLGTILVDVDSNYLRGLIDGPVFRKAGHFVLLTQSGKVIADLSKPDYSFKTYQDIPELDSLWQQIDAGGSGFLKGSTGYWAYAAVPRQDWILLGFVPYVAVYQRIFLITAVTTAVVMGLLVLILFLALGKLNSRLKPILLQFSQLPQTEPQILTDWHQQDELNQLSLGFFKILEQLNEQEDTIRHYKQALGYESRYADQLIEQFLEFTTRIDEEANNQQGLIQSAQTLMAAQNYQSVDIQLDALLTMGQALDGDLKRIPTDLNASELFASMEQHIEDLSEVLDHHTSALTQPQLQALMDQLTDDIANFKTYDRSHPSLKQLQYQASNIAQAGRAAMDNSRNLLTVMQRITEAFVKIEAITKTLNQQIKFASDMLWIDLEQRKDLITHDDWATGTKVTDDSHPD